MKALPAEVESDLVRLAQAGDMAARDELLEQFTPLMWRFAGRAATPQLEADELFQLCYFAFARSLRLFDLGRNVRFITYLYQALAKEMCQKRLIRHLLRIPRRASVKIHSLDNGDGKSASWGSQLAAPAPDECVVEKRDQLRLIEGVLDNLVPREKQILEMRMNSLTLQAIGDQLGITKERVRQLEQRALRSIRASLNVEVSR